MAIILSMILISPNVKADIAPYDRIGHSIEGFFIRQDNISMISFSVIVTVNLPDVHEEFTYILKNNVNISIEMEAIIPIVFEEDRWEYYEHNNIQIFIDDKLYHDYNERKLMFDDVLLNDRELIRDIDHYTGVTMNLSFEPYQEMEIKMIANSRHDDYTESFHYFYTAKTAKFWNGTIQYSYFEFNYLSKMKSIEFNVPNGTLVGTRITSTMYNWTGQSNYEITVDTGVRYHHNYYPIIIQLICFGIILFTVIIIIIIYNIRKAFKVNTK